jgi:heme oxygenase
MADHTGSLTHPARPIMVRLKEETKDYHLRLESLSYFSVLADHKLPLECYVGQLSALAILHGVMENEIGACVDKRVSTLWSEELKKLPLLEKDIAFFRPRILSDLPSVIEIALAMTDKIRLRGIERPVSLLGYLYVFEGSTLGNAGHRPDISATFHLNALVGCAYYASYQDQVKRNWKRFSEKMDSVLADPSGHDAIIEAAQEAFEGLKELYSALYPLKKEAKVYHVTRINPEAGNHPIPADEREIRAALEASNRGWAEFPYYKWRFGDRGKRFSDSDTCWLATLITLEGKELEKQIAWLGRVLATRGMPVLMLETTLRVLYEELVKAVPDKKLSYDKLLEAAAAFFRERTKQIAESEVPRLAGDFEAAVGPELAEQYKNTGRLLMSAVADEKNGREGAVSAIQEWMTDPDRFPKAWISAVNDIIRKATALSDGPSN